MSKIREKIMADYRKEIEIVDVDLTLGIWGTMTIKIIDNNKKHFKKKTIYKGCWYDSDAGVQYYIDNYIDDYIERQIGYKIEKLEAEEIISKYKKESGIGV